MIERGLPIPRDERGMILINVLIIVMLTTAVLAVMLAGEQDDVERTSGLRFAGQAQATARGAELSAVVALRRDLARDNLSDTLQDEWATIGDRDVRIPGGRFSFAVGDAQAKFNVNDLARGDANSRDLFARIAAAAGAKADVVDRVGALLAIGGPVGDLAALRVAGIDDADLRRLAQFCTALPQSTDINVNTAPEPLLAIVLGNAATARSLASERSHGALNAQRMQSAGKLLPPGTGVRSDFFWSMGQVTMGDTRQRLTSLIYRHVDDGKPVAFAIRRWRGTAPIEAPSLP